jgi:hypothetical protein
MYGYGYSLYNRLAFLGGLDPDATAFFSATGITDPTIQGAINSLCVDLKKYGVWDKMKAIYPFVGGTATTHKFNLKDSRDLDDAFRLSFLGGWTHSTDVATPNGTNGYANTFLIPNTTLQLNSVHLSFYTNTQTNFSSAEMGSRNLGSDALYMVRHLSGSNFDTANNATSSTTSSPNLSGLYLMNRNNSSNYQTIRNTVTEISRNIASNSKSTIPLFIGAVNNSSTAQYFSNKNIRFASIGDGLTDTDSLNLYYSIQKFQTTLGRQVGTPIYSSNATDVNARLFLGATNIQDATITSAVDTLVQGLKTDGVWSKLKAVYPFVGGTATTHKFNLANALDEDSAFRLSFFGGWTHSTNGATPNGTNGYADTFLNPATNLATNNSSLGYYGGNVVTPSDATAIGSLLSAPFRVFAIAPALSGFGLFGDVNDGSSTFTSNNRQDGFIFASRDNSLNKIHSIRGTQTLKTEVSTSAPSVVAVIGARRFSTTINSYCNFNFRLAFMGNGLTSTEATNLHTRVQAFQTTLNRQV